MNEVGVLFEESMEKAERDCFDKICEVLGLQEGRSAFLSVNGGEANCVVFDIGSPESGEVLAFPARQFHWRGQLDCYNVKRRQIQKWLMRLVAAMPISAIPGQGTSEKMPEGSNVVHFRIAPLADAIKTITTTTLKYGAGDKGREVFTSSVVFDIVFNAGSREG